MDETSECDLASAADLTCAGKIWLDMHMIPEEVWRDSRCLEDGSYEFVYPVDLNHYNGPFATDVKALGVGYWDSRIER